MSQTTLNVRIDSQLKKQFEELCSDFGMSPSTAVNIFVRTLVRERRIPFEIAAPLDPFYGEAKRSQSADGDDCGLKHFLIVYKHA